MAPNSNFLWAVLAIAVYLQPNTSAMPVGKDKRQVAGLPPYVLSYGTLFEVAQWDLLC